MCAQPDAGHGRPEPGADAALRSRPRPQQTAGRPGRCRQADRQPPRLAGHHLFLRRFHRHHQLCALRRPRPRSHRITRDSCVPANKVEAFFKNPFADLDAARTAPLKIEKALIGPCPTQATAGWWRSGLYLFMAFLCHGPRRVRLAGALRTDAHAHPLQRHEHRAGHQPARLHHAGRHLPALRRQVRLLVDVLSFAGFTVVYFLIAAFFLPETKGKTLEEIEAHFEGRG